MLNTRLVTSALAALILAMATFTADCRSARSEITQAVARRQDAVASGDKALYMSLLSKHDPEYILEQSRWFDYRLTATIAGFRLELEALKKIGRDEYIATVRQTYRIGDAAEPREVAYQQRYVRVDNAWLDADLYLKEKASDHFILKYQESTNETIVARILEHAESAWYSVRRAYGDAPAGKTTIKAFTDRELLRQSSKITIGKLFNGWAEPGESIKMWVRPDSRHNYKPMIAHELVHKHTLSIAANQCSWFTEGLANWYGNFAAQGGDYLQSGYHVTSDYNRSIAWLATSDSQMIDNDADWAIYGGMAGTIIRFITERYGRETPQALVLALASYPQDRPGYVYALHDAAMREELAGAIHTVLGISMDNLESEWRTWLNRQNN